MVGVGATASLGWILLISVSYTIVSIDALLETSLPLPMGQVFLNVLGKRGMLAIWSLIIIVQVCHGQLNPASRSTNCRWHLVCDWSCSGRRRFACVLRVRQRQCPPRIQILEEDEPLYADPS